MYIDRPDAIRTVIFYIQIVPIPGRNETRREEPPKLVTQLSAFLVSGCELVAVDEA